MRLAVLPGTYNPPTRAHLALAAAALPSVDEVVLVLPRQLPHKSWDGLPPEVRLEMLVTAAEAHPRFSVAQSEGGLLVDIARECAETHPGAQVCFLCGRDAAERIIGWRYDGAPPLEEQLRRFSLLVAARQGSFQPPAELADRIALVSLDPDFDWHSATEVRTRIAEGRDWRELVPPSIIPLVERHIQWLRAAGS